MNINYYFDSMKKILLLLLVLLCAAVADAQRIYQNMGRGVVAVTRNSGTDVTVSWRKLTNDPDSCTYNLYKRSAGGTSYTKVNDKPYVLTSAKFSGSVIPYNTELAVTTVAKDGTESDFSVPFLYKKLPYPNLWMYIEYDNTVIKRDDYSTKYVWPADLDGDGEMNEFVVDRLYDASDDEDEDSTSTTATHHMIQAYSMADGLLWTVDMGPNVNISAGQNDMVTVYDIDCDGKCEVLIKSSDGTRFWDKANNTWGKYCFGKMSPDVDGDGIVDYCEESVTRNPPFYITVIDGMTGAEKTSAELNYAEVRDNEDVYTRDNKKDYWSTKGYYQMGGHFAITYDGVRPLLMMKCLDRSTETGHHDYVFAFSYDWNNGQPSNFHHSYTWSRNDKTPWPAEFHGNRVCDVDGDGIDEIIPGAWATNPWKDMIASPGIGHGDRFTVTDIDPTRPGLEEYAIQQTSLLGQLIYDPATGEHVKEWYQAVAGDVNRGQCADVDSTRLGDEIWSFVSDNIYDCKGNNTGVSRPYPNEPVWWDGDLLREVLNTPGGKGRGTNMMVSKLPNDGNRLAQFSRESSWATHGNTGTRPGFWGDIKGDWREEIILMVQSTTTSTGIAAYATDYTSDKVITCLQEDPHYRLDCTCRGYYQSPNTDFYLGHGMPKEPVYPCVETDLRYHNGDFRNGQWTNYDQSQSQSYADGKSVLFDMSGQDAILGYDYTAEVDVNETVSPSAVWLMNPKGRDYIFNGAGTLAGNMTLTKGMQGTATFNMDLNYTGKTVVSEGTLAVNGKMESPLYLMARGSMSGNTTFNAPIFFEGALNYEGCRLLPGGDGEVGSMTFNKDLTVPGNTYLYIDIADSVNIDKYVVNGNLTLQPLATSLYNTKIIFFVKPLNGTLEAGTYTLMECSGTLTATAEDVEIQNLVGVPYRVAVNGNKIQLLVDTQRQATENVVWAGTESAEWDYLTRNFLVDGNQEYFVTGDKVVFDDTASKFNVTVNDNVITNEVLVNADKNYKFTGSGSISGEGALIKNGAGSLTISMDNNDYTGQTVVNSGRLIINSMANGGAASSIGAAPATKGSIQLNGSEMWFNGDNCATDRPITITDTALIAVNKSASSLTLTGRVNGTGTLIKDGEGQMNFNYPGVNNVGGFILRKGTLSQGEWNSNFGEEGTPIRFEGGTLQLRTNTSMSTTPVLNNNIYVDEGKKGTIVGSYRCAIKGSVYGKGTLTIQSGGVRCDIYNDFANFEGKLIAEGAEFRLQNAKDMSKTTLELTGEIAVSPSSSELRIGSLVSTDKTPSMGGSSVMVGVLNKNDTYAGLLKSTSVSKYGTGVWKLTGTGSSSPILVKKGSLCIYNSSNASGESMTSGTVTVDDGASLIGKGKTNVINLKAGGILNAGTDEKNIGTIITGGNIICSGTSTIVVKASTATNSKYTIGGTLMIKGDTLRIQPINGRTFKAGDVLTIFTGTMSSSAKWTLDGGGYQWDDSQLKETGKLVCLGEDLYGDANNDGTIDVADITAIAAYILGNTPESWSAVKADANRDGVIDVADITATAGIILSIQSAKAEL